MPLTQRRWFAIPHQCAEPALHYCLHSVRRRAIHPTHHAVPNFRSHGRPSGFRHCLWLTTKRKQHGLRPWGYLCMSCSLGCAIVIAHFTYLPSSNIIQGHDCSNAKYISDNSLLLKFNDIRLASANRFHCFFRRLLGCERNTSGEGSPCHS